VIDQAQKLPHLLRKQLKIIDVNPLLSRSENESAWDSWGVRDIAILTDQDGKFLIENNALVGYYTGSTNEGELQQIGRVFSYDDGDSWVKDENNPVLTTSSNSWDCKVAATPWVIKKDNTYYLYYRGSPNACIEDAVGVATSQDGIRFEKYRDNPILTANHFPGIRSKPSEMGVMNAIANYEGEILILFEANESQFDQRGQIFSAKSSDGFNFVPMNNGNPIFSARNVSSWPVVGVCNPRLTKIGAGWYMLGFNGTLRGEYSIGIAFTRDLVHWIEHPNNPIMVPRGWPVFADFTYRLEGPCFNSETLVSEEEKIDCYFMAIPYGAKNHQNSIIGKATFELKDLESEVKVHRLPVHNTSVEVNPDWIHLSSTQEPGNFVQCHLIEKSLSNITFDINFLNNGKNAGAVYIAFSDNVNCLPAGNGLILKINSKAIYVRQPKQLTESLVIRIFTKAVLYAYRLIEKISPYLEPTPRDGWHEFMSIESEIPISFALTYEKKGNDKKVRVVINEMEKLLSNFSDEDKNQIITLACYNANATFKNIRYNI